MGCVVEAGVKPSQVGLNAYRRISFWHVLNVMARKAITDQSGLYVTAISCGLLQYKLKCCD